MYSTLKKTLSTPKNAVINYKFTFARLEAIILIVVKSFAEFGAQLVREFGNGFNDHPFSLEGDLGELVGRAPKAVAVFQNEPQVSTDTGAIFVFAGFVFPWNWFLLLKYLMLNYNTVQDTVLGNKPLKSSTDIWFAQSHAYFPEAT